MPATRRRPTKIHQRREVPIPRFHAAELAAHLEGKQPDDLVFAGIRNGQPLRVSTFRTAFTAAAKAIDVPGLHPHELRHTAASLAIASGADVKVVHQMLGHNSATMTLDTYGHLFEDRLDEVRPCTPDRIRTGATAVKGRPRGRWAMLASNEPAGQRDNGWLATVGGFGAFLDLVLPQCCPRPRIEATWL